MIREKERDEFEMKALDFELELETVRESVLEMEEELDSTRNTLQHAQQQLQELNDDIVAVKSLSFANEQPSEEHVTAERTAIVQNERLRKALTKLRSASKTEKSDLMHR